MYLLLIPPDKIFERIETIAGLGCFNKASDVFTLALPRFGQALVFLDFDSFFLTLIYYSDF